MDASLLLIATDSEAPTQRCRAAIEAIDHHWQPTGDRPEIRCEHVGQLLEEPARLNRGVALWLILDHPDSGRQYELLALAEHHGLPTLLTRHDETRMLGQQQQDGVTICPPDTEGKVCCAMLQSLASQSGLIQSLNNELRLLNSQGGGLRDQMGKLDEELRLAAQLQQRFVPQKMPPMGELAVHPIWRAANYVSGDIYDIIRLDENHIGLFIVDAVGHGVPAALMTMYIKRSLNVKETGPHLPHYYRLLEPAEALSQLNQDMLETQSGQVHFATACYCTIDCRTWEVRLARAGHPHPMLLRQGAEAHMLAPEGGLLGVFEQQPEDFEQTTFTLVRGDRLLLYSDGFELAFPDCDDQGQQHVNTERYAEEFQDLAQGDPQEALDRLMAKVDSQEGSLNQQDDLTVLCLATPQPSQNVEPAASAAPKTEAAPVQASITA
jgi:sigma-B regulation protein RsbU (phosphoserine phosphatase)